MTQILPVRSQLAADRMGALRPLRGCGTTSWIWHPRQSRLCGSLFGALRGRRRPAEQLDLHQAANDMRGDDVDLLNLRGLIAGRAQDRSQKAAMARGPLPVNPTVVNPISRAACKAATMLGDRPEVEIAMKTSPGRPRPRT
jgi:hypothetical protein